MRGFYLGRHQVRYGDNDAVECESGTSGLKEIVEEAIDQYSYAEFGKTFDKSTLSLPLNEIESTLLSTVFVTDCLKILVADFAAEADKPSASEDTIRSAIAEVVGWLIECGWDRRSLSSLSKSKPSGIATPLRPFTLPFGAPAPARVPPCLPLRFRITHAITQSP
jgi:hypothetical protein